MLQLPGYFTYKMNVLRCVWHRMHLMSVCAFHVGPFPQKHIQLFFFYLNLNFLDWIQQKIILRAQLNLTLDFNIIFHLSCWRKEGKCKHQLVSGIFTPDTSWKVVQVTDCLGSNTLYTCIQGVPGEKDNILGGHSIGHSKQKTLY
jgi:hypothetical protein